ncbi:5-methyltetrahydropteroyltriglutamate--homocysteine methyltransferase [Roseococcus sp. SYP-B2431]|uniref:cobalamin-independent methionine synthase II family protein n=1 Tax=Roseococcus sp. SYP-B2431 TaxID=2496640 RepID=UPI00103AAE7E|nr:cobalamin-independent methionine synthase II family protein [Roseococcus sp. SYP-B2431]TCH99453.1 5-methyltetrahydropteroyltriglutamate--homocysteine methyltransferase [Roseococcus sp. SYP-B2431]
MADTLPLLPTTVVGSYPQPAWLVDQEALRQRLVPRVRAPEIWRVPEERLHAAQDDATLLAMRDMERAGIDIITDGEIRRESYSNHFANSLEGIDAANPGEVIGRTGKPTLVPRVVGRVKRAHAVEVEDIRFARANTDRQLKITLPGAFTMTRQAKNEFYKDEADLAMDYAAALNEEILELKAAGVDVIQLDEPWMQAFPEEARRFAVAAINRALKDVPGTTIVHMCFGYAAMVDGKPSGYSFLPELSETIAQQVSIEAAQPNLDLGVLRELNKTVLVGVLDLSSPEVETPEIVAERLRRALKVLPAERIVAAPDCGMKYLPRERAFGKLKAMAEGAAIVRREIQ